MEKKGGRMLSLSQTTGYAILAMACLDGPGGVCVHVGYLAKHTRIPGHYLFKIMRILAEKGFVKAKRGNKGGFLLSRYPEEITLLEVVEAIEGPDWKGGCLLGFPEIWNKRACPIYDFCQGELRRIEEKLRSKRLSEMENFRRRFPRTITPSRRRCMK